MASGASGFQASLKEARGGALEKRRTPKRGPLMLPWETAAPSGSV